MAGLGVEYKRYTLELGARRQHTGQLAVIRVSAAESRDHRELLGTLGFVFVIRGKLLQLNEHLGRHRLLQIC